MKEQYDERTADVMKERGKSSSDQSSVCITQFLIFKQVQYARKHHSKIVGGVHAYT